MKESIRTEKYYLEQNVVVFTGESEELYYSTKTLAYKLGSNLNIIHSHFSESTSFDEFDELIDIDMVNDTEYLGEYKSMVDECVKVFGHLFIPLELYVVLLCCFDETANDIFKLI